MKYYDIVVHRAGRDEVATRVTFDKVSDHVSQTTAWKDLEVGEIWQTSEHDEEFWPVTITCVEDTEYFGVGVELPGELPPTQESVDLSLTKTAQRQERLAKTWWPTINGVRVYLEFMSLATFDEDLRLRGVPVYVISKMTYREGERSRSLIGEPARRGFQHYDDALAEYCLWGSQLQAELGEPTYSEVPRGAAIVAVENPEAQLPETLPPTNESLDLSLVKHARTLKNVGVFAKLPEELAKQFPSLGDEDPSPPHVTVLYIGDLPEEKYDAFLGTVKMVCGEIAKPFKAKLDGLGKFEHNDKGQRVWFVKIESEGLHHLHKLLENECEAIGVILQSDHKEYVPHATLEYQDEPGEYAGSVPAGEWEVKEVEVWKGEGEGPVVKVASMLLQKLAQDEDVVSLIVDAFKRDVHSFGGYWVRVLVTSSRRDAVRTLTRIQALFEKAFEESWVDDYNVDPDESNEGQYQISVYLSPRALKVLQELPSEVQLPETLPPTNAAQDGYDPQVLESVVNDVAKAKRGDVEAKERLVERFSSLMWSIVHKAPIQPQDWNDAYQELYTAFDRAIRGYDKKTNVPFYAYLKSALENEALRHAERFSRPREREISLDLPATNEEGEETTLGDTLMSTTIPPDIYAQVRDIYNKVHNELAGRDRYVFEQLTAKGLSPVEIVRNEQWGRFDPLSLPGLRRIIRDHILPVVKKYKQLYVSGSVIRGAHRVEGIELGVAFYPDTLDDNYFVEIVASDDYDSGTDIDRRRALRDLEWTYQPAEAQHVLELLHKLQEAKRRERGKIRDVWAVVSFSSGEESVDLEEYLRTRGFGPKLPKALPPTRASVDIVKVGSDGSRTRFTKVAQRMGALINSAIQTFRANKDPLTREMMLDIIGKAMTEHGDLISLEEEGVETEDIREVLIDSLAGGDAFHPVEDSPLAEKARDVIIGALGEDAVVELEQEIEEFRKDRPDFPETLPPTEAHINLQLARTS